MGAYKGACGWVRQSVCWSAPECPSDNSWVEAEGAHAHVVHRYMWCQCVMAWADMHLRCLCHYRVSADMAWVGMLDTPLGVACFVLVSCVRYNKTHPTLSASAERQCFCRGCALSEGHRPRTTTHQMPKRGFRTHINSAQECVPDTTKCMNVLLRGGPFLHVSVTQGYPLVWQPGGGGSVQQPTRRTTCI